MVYKKYFLLIILIFVLKLATLGLYDFYHLSEIRYASIAMRMVITGNYLMPHFTPSVLFLGKPPLSFWASAISFKIFGFNEFAGRLPHFFALVAACLYIYHAVEKIYDRETGIVSVLILSSFTLFYALQSVMTEGFLFLGMTILTLSFFLQLKSYQAKNIYGYLFFIGCAIAMLTKGPVGIFMPGLPIAVYLTYKSRWRDSFTKFPIFTGSLIFIAISLPWFLLAEHKYPGFLKYFILGENFSRFLKPGWSGDLYGRAHHVPIGTIWLFFIGGTLPAIFIFFARPKTMFITIVQNCKKDDAFLFLVLCCLIPLIFLTFMRNMIMTYALYSLMPFTIILARILMLKNWHKFIAFLGGITVVLYLSAITAFIINPNYLEEKINYQTYLIKKIPGEILKKRSFKLYYFGIENNNFGGYWMTKDRIKIVKQKDLIKILDKNKGPVYIVGDRQDYGELSQEYQNKLETIICANSRNACLYKRYDSTETSSL